MHPMNRKSNQRAECGSDVVHMRGFTLLELIVVLSLLAIITGALVPLYGSSMATIQMRSVQSDFLALLTFTQERAVAESREYRLYLDEKEGTHWVMRFARIEDNEKVFEPVKAEWGRLTHLPKVMEFKGIKARKDRDRAAQFIGCYPNGACDTVSVTLSDTRSRKRQFTIETLGTVGKVEVDR